ncbi:MAG: hypothetical protein J5940_00740 [Clostridia bacterium]|nr:hypothetical protein [Clostridia bacterium]
MAAKAVLSEKAKALHEADVPFERAGMDELAAFAEACAAQAVVSGQRTANALGISSAPPDAPGGIGTLGEKTLHSVLKFYCEPDARFHEIKVGGFVADIKRGDVITEIQTRDFSRFRKKLPAFIRENRVTVVFPVARSKRIIKINEATGEYSPPRRSPRVGSIYSIIPELYRINMLLKDPAFQSRVSFRTVFLGVDEYRLIGKATRRSPHGRTCYEKIPTALYGHFDVASKEDFKKFIPEGLPESFTSLDFAKAAKIRRGVAQTALNVLTSVGAVTRVGKAGNTIIYNK